MGVFTCIALDNGVVQDFFKGGVAKWGGGGGGTLTLFFSFVNKKGVSILQTHGRGIGVSSYMINLSDKHRSKK